MQNIFLKSLKYEPPTANHFYKYKPELAQLGGMVAEWNHIAKKKIICDKEIVQSSAYLIPRRSAEPLKQFREKDHLWKHSMLAKIKFDSRKREKQMKFCPLPMRP